MTNITRSECVAVVAAAMNKQAHRVGFSDGARHVWLTVLDVLREHRLPFRPKSIEHDVWTEFARLNKRSQLDLVKGIPGNLVNEDKVDSGAAWKVKVFKDMDKENHARGGTIAKVDTYNPSSLEIYHTLDKGNKVLSSAVKASAQVRSEQVLAEFDAEMLRVEINEAFRKIADKQSTTK